MAKVSETDKTLDQVEALISSVSNASPGTNFSIVVQDDGKYTVEYSSSSVRRALTNRTPQQVKQFISDGVSFDDATSFAVLTQTSGAFTVAIVLDKA